MRDERGRRRSSPSSLVPHPSSLSSSRSEFDFIASVRRRAERRGRGGGVVRGIGDDAAVLRFKRDAVVTADLLVEDVDFRRTYMPPRLLGHKALAVSLSDLAAMGARPRFALLSVGVPRAVWKTRFLEDFYAGFGELAERHQVALVGGDVSRTPRSVVIDSIVLGEVAPRRAVLRSGARPGDRIYVTGALGGSAAGLRLLEGGARLKANSARAPSSDPRQRLMLRHLRPEPRVGWGRWLGEQRIASSMIDISDGLSSDLAHLCRESGVGARIETARVPVDSFIAPARLDADALALALDGGEDFELLFTVRPRLAARLPKRLGGARVTEIGEVTAAENKIELIEGARARPLRPAGFTHFKAPD